MIASPKIELVYKNSTLSHEQRSNAPEVVELYVPERA